MRHPRRLRRRVSRWIHRRRRMRRQEDRGVSSIELVLYMPLMFFAIFVTVQFGLMYLGNQAALAAAREMARVARTGGDAATAESRGAEYLATVGRGVIEPTDLAVEFEPGGDAVQATVIGVPLQVVPLVPMPRIEQVVRGPVEGFRVDDGP